MNEIIPFKKDILFKTRINEITDIMLEHDYKIMDDMIDGDFILQGSYKMTEASVITEDFFYKIPFSIAVNDDVLKESINLTIKDFKYEIVNSDILKLDISLNLNCEVREDKEEFNNYEEEIKESIEEVLEENKELEEENNDRNDIEVVNETIEEKSEKIMEIPEEIEKEIKEIISDKEVEIKEVEEKMTNEDFTGVIESVKEKNDYVTYKVYLAKENDTFDSISAKYDIDKNELRKYNDEEISIGDKIIIPYIFNDK